VQGVVEGGGEGCERHGSRTPTESAAPREQRRENGAQLACTQHAVSSDSVECVGAERAGETSSPVLRENREEGGGPHLAVSNKFRCPKCVAMQAGNTLAAEPIKQLARHCHIHVSSLRIASAARRHRGVDGGDTRQ
jgi:hypothetical protein